MVGRPTKFTPEHKEKLIEAIRKGAPYEIACNYARIDTSTLYNWMALSREGKEEYVLFFQDLKEAEGQTCLRWLEVIDKAMEDGTWSAAAWKLERRQYKHFSAHAPMLEMNDRLEKLELGDPKNEEAETEE